MHSGQRRKGTLVLTLRVGNAGCRQSTYIENVCLSLMSLKNKGECFMTECGVCVAATRLMIGQPLSRRLAEETIVMSLQMLVNLGRDRLCTNHLRHQTHGAGKVRER